MKQTILIVDDDPEQAILLRRILQQAGFKEITTVKDGKEAINFLKTEGASLILSEINILGMNGYELCLSIKSDSILKRIPFLFCTAFTDPEKVLYGLENMADGYITKPYKPDILVKTIHEFLNTPLLPSYSGLKREEITVENKKYYIASSRQQIINYFITIYQNILQQAKGQIYLQKELKQEYAQLKASSIEQEQLLYNILPLTVAEELIAYGSVIPKRFEEASVMFTDFVGFTSSAKKISPQCLIAALEYYFEVFDNIISTYRLDKIKTIGDGYMCASGASNVCNTHAIDCILAGLNIIQFVQEKAEFIKKKFQVSWNIRIGINSGPVIAAIIGKKCIAYDIWGDTVNIASRMESLGVEGKINISAATYERVKSYVDVTAKGSITIKEKNGKGATIDMYIIDKLKKPPPELGVW